MDSRGRGVCAQRGGCESFCFFGASERNSFYPILRTTLHTTLHIEFQGALRIKQVDPMASSQRPLAVTGLNDDDDDEVDENSSGAKRVLARLGVAMARYSSHLLCYYLSA